ncbi:MAG: Rab family GTPase [Candidatus Helarchaeota archaeon]
MKREYIQGILYSQFDEKAGPKAEIWVPSSLSRKVQDLVSLKTINIFSGEGGIVPKSLAVIPFPSIQKKGLVKFMEIKDPERRGNAIDSSLTLLFDESDDLIFYKYIKNFESVFNQTAEKIIHLEEKKAKRKEIQTEIDRFHRNIRTILDELRDREFATQEVEFPVTADEEVDLKTYEYKIIVVGDPHVGKTSTILRFTDNAFRRTYIPTLGVNLSSKKIRYNSVHIKFILWDIAGQSKFQTMRRPFYKGADGLILVFDLTDQTSFQNVTSWYQDIKNTLQSAFPPGILLGNKNDLVADRQVSQKSIKNLAKKLGFNYFETSALTGENIPEAFQEMAKLLYGKKKGAKTSKK